LINRDHEVMNTAVLIGAFTAVLGSILVSFDTDELTGLLGFAAVDGRLPALPHRRLLGSGLRNKFHSASAAHCFLRAGKRTARAPTAEFFIAVMGISCSQLTACAHTIAHYQVDHQVERVA
jgi:hypothetical protein